MRIRENPVPVGRSSLAGMEMRDADCADGTARIEFVVNPPAGWRHPRLAGSLPK